MRKKTGISIAIAFVLVIMLSAGAYSYLGGPTPSKNMGSYNSFSFYPDTSGNAAVQWMQPGNAPSNPADEFWFGPSGDFHTSAGITSPGPVAIGTNSTTANNLAQLTADANFAGTVYFTGNATLTQSLTTTCDLRIVKGAVITAPLVTALGTISTAADQPDFMLTLSNATDYAAMQPGTVIVVNTAQGTKYCYVSRVVGSMEVCIENWADCYNGGSGYSFSYTPYVLNINGTFEAGTYQVFGTSTGVVFAPNSVNTLSPAWWGALGNKVADDTFPIQMAFSVAGNMGVSVPFQGAPGTVEFTSGANYKTTAEIVKKVTVTVQGNGAVVWFTPPSTVTSSAAFATFDADSYLPYNSLWLAGGWHNFTINGPLSGSGLGTIGNPPSNSYVGIFCGGDYRSGITSLAPVENICMNDVFDRITFTGLTTGFQYLILSSSSLGIVGASEDIIQNCTFTANYDAIGALPSTYGVPTGISVGAVEQMRAVDINISNNVNCAVNTPYPDEWVIHGGSLDYNGYSVCGSPWIDIISVHEETRSANSPGGSSSTSPSGVPFWNLTSGAIVRKTGGLMSAGGAYYKGFVSAPTGTTISMRDVILAVFGDSISEIAWTNASASLAFCYDGLAWSNLSAIPISDATAVTCTHN